MLVVVSIRRLVIRSRHRFSGQARVYDGPQQLTVNCRTLHLTKSA